MSETAYSRVTFDGKLVNARTRDALLYAQALWRRRGGHRKSIRLAKGSYQPASATSGTTHSGGGAVDVRTRGVGLTDAGEPGACRPRTQGFRVSRAGSGTPP